MPRTGGEERRVTIVEEAIRQIGRDGYRGASLDNIATAVGVRKQTLLYYFPTKDALLEACLSAAGERLAREIAGALAGKESYWDRAEAVYRRALAIDAGDGDVRVRLGGVLLRLQCVVCSGQPEP